MYLVAEWKSRKGRDTGFQILNLLLSESQNIQWLQLIPVFSLNPFQRCSEVLGSGSVLCLISMLELHHFLYWAITHFGPSVSSSLSSHSPKSISNIHSFTEALLLLLCKYLGGGGSRGQRVAHTQLCSGLVCLAITPRVLRMEFMLTMCKARPIHAVVWLSRMRLIKFLCICLHSLGQVERKVIFPN